ncbi:hypothetical protein HK097_008513 [Rhizophlyctis rosea]|uniref:E3 ubiquitin-protein ligase CHFR n=1 Tax=Rhizophlyctis rosea TaxID=64517 RepID=A0AAD5SA87_9FUNG|nr:hypothetical protein HK097_008513 [Rhizophlyctis rosea]
MASLPSLRLVAQGPYSSQHVNPVPLIQFDDNNNRLTVGRDPTSSVHLRTPNISRLHATLTLSHDRKTIFVRDEGSLTGVTINRVRIPAKEDMELKIGYIIAFGGAFRHQVGDIVNTKSDYVYKVEGLMEDDVEEESFVADRVEEETLGGDVEQSEEPESPELLRSHPEEDDWNPIVIDDPLYLPSSELQSSTPTHPAPQPTPPDPDPPTRQKRKREDESQSPNNRRLSFATNSHPTTSSFPASSSSSSSLPHTETFFPLTRRSSWQQELHEQARNIQHDRTMEDLFFPSGPVEEKRDRIVVDLTDETDETVEPEEEVVVVVEEGKGKEKETENERAKQKSDLAERIEEHLLCSICMDMLVAPHSLNPCGHTFCGPCIDEWITRNKKTCPQCRSTITPPSIPSHVIQNIVEATAPTVLTADELTDREKRIQGWKDHQEAKRKEEEEKKKAKEERRRARRSGGVVLPPIQRNDLQRNEHMTLLQLMMQRAGHAVRPLGDRGITMQMGNNTINIEDFRPRSINGVNVNEEIVISDDDDHDEDDEDEEEEHEEDFELEYSPSNRAGCRGCGHNIAFGIPRFAVEEEGEEYYHPSRRFWHVECYVERLPAWVEGGRDVAGYDRLNSQDRRMVNDVVRGRRR